MRPFADRVSLLLAALWWGGLSALSFLAVPLAFAHFGNPIQAGPYAAKLFQIQSWASLCISLLLLLRLRAAQDKILLQRLLPWLLLSMLTALLQEFGVAQHILAARSSGADVRLWHSLGTLLVLLQWTTALKVFMGLAWRA